MPGASLGLQWPCPVRPRFGDALAQQQQEINTAAFMAMLKAFFKLEERGSSVRSEIIGGITTFVTMAYIMVVNPAILSAAGIPPGPGTVATIVTAVFGCVLMGLVANRPIAVAPYMGENAFIAFGL